MKMEVEAGSSLLHDITKAAASLCVLVCNPFARERWYIVYFRYLQLVRAPVHWYEHWFRVAQFRGSGLRVQERQ